MERCPKCDRKLSEAEKKVISIYDFDRCIFCRRDASAKTLKPEYRKRFLDSYK